MSRSGHPRLALRLVFGLLCVLFAADVYAQATPTLDHFLCLRAKPAPRIDRALKFAPHPGMTLRNRIAASLLKVDIRKPVALCAPASVAGSPVQDAATFLETYSANLSRTRPPQVRPVIGVQRITNRFGSEELRLKAVSGVMVASSAVIDPPPAPVAVPSTSDDFACYDAERTGGLRSRPASATPLTIESAIGTLLVDVKVPSRVCFPSNLAGANPSAASHPGVLACYVAKLTRTKPPQEKPFPQLVATANRFGTEQLSLTATLDFCVPSEAVGVGASPTPARTTTPSPTPTVTPPPDFTLKVGPAALTVDIGTSPHLTATAFYKNGNVVDFTERVVWRSSTEAALAPNSLGDRGRIDAVDAGSAVISVLDEQTGVSSTDTGDDAILTINWTLQRIELLPTTVTRGRGESVRLRATGHFANGFTRSIAERLVYASSKPNVAAPTNDPTAADHSRVIAVGEGSAVLSATDPLSGVSSTTSGDDVAMTVLTPMQRCEVTEEIVGLVVGDYHQFTAIGYYAGDFHRVITQQVEWTSDEPTLVATPNTEGDRSRVLALGPGDAHITATDTVTGVVCAPHPLVRVGIPSSLFLQPPDPRGWFPLRAGRSWHAIAIERFDPPVGKEYVTEDVVFTSSDPTIVAAPNVAGDRGRLDAVGSGTAFIKATDPRNGLVSQNVALRSLAGLTRVQVSDGKMSVVDANRTFFLTATGLFGDGPATLEPSDLTYVSDNPAVAEVTFTAGSFTGGSWRVHTIAPGAATISAIDIPTGISSDAFGQSLRLGVRGPIERITLVPPTVTRRAGEKHPFAAVVHYGGGISEIGTQQLVYSSSDPAVAVATNDYWVRGRVDAIAGGIATITATDPVTGVSSADSGESAVLTVVGPLTRVRIQPPYVTRSVGRSFSFTAIGNDAAGRTVNVTQDVTWSSSNENIARATNPEGNRSRVVAYYQTGTATISAYDPQNGVRSSDSGEDATFVTDGYLGGIALSTTQTVLTVGETVQLTATGYLNNGSTVNLTQEVEYTSSNPSVARADNVPGDRSRITALKSGSAIITARDPATGIITNTNGRVTLVVTPP